MSFWGKLGKAALKVAPIAAGFIPGVGPLASMAIGAGTSALSKKLEGGNWKDALKSGAIGGATGYIGGKIGPSDPTKFLKSDVANVAAKATGKSGLWSKVGDVATKTGKSIFSDKLGGTGGSTPGIVADNPNEARDAWKVMLEKYLKGRSTASTPPFVPPQTTPTLPGMSPQAPGKDVPGVYGWQGQSFGDFPYRNPNFGAAIQRGKMKARRGISPSYAGAR
jgi:hypothetical protein